MLLVGRDVDEAGVGLAATAVLDKHLPALHHLNVVIFREWLIGIKVEEGPHTAQNTLDILSVRFELVDADTVVNFLKLDLRVFGGALAALLHELFECESMLWVNARVVIQRVQEDKAVSEQECLVFAVEVLWVLL